MVQRVVVTGSAENRWEAKKVVTKQCPERAVIFTGLVTTPASAVPTVRLPGPAPRRSIGDWVDPGTVGGSGLMSSDEQDTSAATFTPYSSAKVRSSASDGSAPASMVRTRRPVMPVAR